MRRILVALILLAALGSGARTLADEGKRERSKQEKKVRELNELSRRLNKVASGPEFSPESQFLHGRIAALLNRAREAPAGSYVLGRLLAASDDLLDGSEELIKAGATRKNEGNGAQEKAARDLERSYFRIKEGEYFARQSKENDAGDYVGTSKRLYQQARAAYDANHYWRSRRLAEAAREVIDALENLAQAAVRIPEPPKL